jgi:hypothetical protein
VGPVMAPDITSRPVVDSGVQIAMCNDQFKISI